MSPEICDRAMLELSIAHDEGRPVAPEALTHVGECSRCSAFASRLGELDSLLAPGDYGQAPDLSPRVMKRVAPSGRPWWSVAAVALVGVVVGALVGGLGTLWDRSRAEDLSTLFHTAGTDLHGLSADLLVVERGFHPTVPERVYAGGIDYSAPEQLEIRLTDTTDYPQPEWIPNDVRLSISNGDMVTYAGAPCPVAALPDCLVEPSLSSVSDQPPFDDGILVPLEIVGPGRSLTWPSAIDVLGTTELDGVPAIQVMSTVAAVELIGAITDHGSWRDLHPTDQVVMWLDEATLVPLRIEIFATDSPERELWQLRHGYDDDPEDQTPLFIIELSGLAGEPDLIDIDLPADAPSGGFVDGEVDPPRPALPEGFTPHRSGSWHLADGGRVEVASWSDGRSWLMVEVARAWDEPRLFGLSLAFVEPVRLGADSLGYLAPDGDRLAIHGETSDVLVTGSVPTDVLVDAAASLGIRGLSVPSTWEEASTVQVDDLPPETLVVDAEGWSALGRIDGDTTTILLTGGGARSVVVTQMPGSRLDPPIGADYSEIDVRGSGGRYNASEATLEWVEDGHVVRMRSDTVGLSELIDLASTMERR